MKDWMTTKELAAYLNVNEKLVYELIEKRGLPGTIITGKWLFKKELVDLWLEQSMQNTSFHLSRLTDVLLVSGSNDLLLERTLMKILPTLSFYSYCGSMRGIDIVKEKKTHMAGIHLYSAEKGNYNVPFLSSLSDYVLVNFAFRRQGALIRKELSEDIKGISDLAGKSKKLVNRQKGSGTRVLLDELLKKEGIPPDEIPGYENEVTSHLEVGLKIMRGEADFGLGIETVVNLLNLSFIPLARERFDIVIPKAYFFIPPVQSFLDTVRSRWFKDIAKEMGGYDTEESGKVLHEG